VPAGRRGGPIAAGGPTLPLGQDEALRALRALRHGTAQALLFAGPDGVGRRLSARWYAALLNCSAAGDDPCGECPSCLGYRPDEEGLVAASDYRELAPAATTRDGKPTRRRPIGIDQLVEREGGASEPLVPWLATPPTHRRRVGLIDDAHTLTDSAANAFLKTLEEPPRHAVIVLVAAGPDALLPTVASRCVVVRFRPVPATPEAWHALHPHPALRLGRPGPLRRAADDDRFAAARDAVAALVQALDGPLAGTFESLGAVGDAWPPGDDLVPGLLREHARARGSAAYVAADAAIEAAEAALAAYAHRELTLKRLALTLRVAWRAPP
jgi:DNA polymerase III subunit delta'